MDAQVNANQALARLAIEQERINATEEQRKLYEKSQENAGQTIQKPVQSNVQQPQAAPPDPKAEAWAEKNEWFGKDEAMTYASFGIQKKLSNERFVSNAPEKVIALERKKEADTLAKIETIKSSLKSLK